MLNSQDLADRQILAAIREENALWKKRYTIIKLDKPIQRGWRRFYELTRIASSRRDAPILEEILKVVGTVVVHHRRDFRRRKGRGRKLIEIEQPLRPIPLYEWERKGYPHAWLAYFHYEILRERNSQPYWVFKQPSIYELKVERNWLWYFQEVDPAIETRLSELDRWLDARRGRQRYGWLKGKSQHFHLAHQASPREQSLELEHQREIRRALDHFPEVDPVASMWRARLSFRRNRTILLSILGSLISIGPRGSKDTPSTFHMLP